MRDGVQIGFVVATYPEGNSIDVILDRDGSRLSNVQVMVPAGSDKTGVVDLPDIGLPADESRWDFQSKPETLVRAVIAAFQGSIPICLGFILPQVNQISFKQKNRRIMRHASDVYTSIDKDGNFELFHPSGTYLRIATSSAHEDLAGTDFDKRWAIEKNTDKAVHVHLGVSNAGSSVASVDIDPNGKIAIQCDSDISIDVGGKADISVQGTTTVTAHGNTQVDVTGTAKVTSSGAMELKGSSIKLDGPTTITGAVTAQSTITATGDVVGAGKSLSTHVHSGVQTGGGVSGPPV